MSVCYLMQERAFLLRYFKDPVEVGSHFSVNKILDPAIECESSLMKNIHVSHKTNDLYLA